MSVSVEVDEVVSNVRGHSETVPGELEDDGMDRVKGALDVPLCNVE